MEETTTVKIGFKTDTQDLMKASQRIGQLQEKLETLYQKTERYRRSNAAGGFNLPGSGKAINMGKGAMSAGFAGLGITTGAIAILGKSVSMAKEYMTALDPLEKQLGYVGVAQENFTTMLEKTGEAIGKNKTEMAQLTQTYVNYAGRQKGAVSSQVNALSLFSKGMGLDATNTAGTMGNMAQMGAFGQYGDMGAERFAGLLAGAISEGGMKGRESEVLSSIQSLMGNQLNLLTRLAPGNTEAMIGTLTAMNASNSPGLMGSRGSNLLTKINSAFTNPTSDFSEYFMYDALGGGNYFDYKMNQEEGIFGAGNLSKVMGSLKSSILNDKSRWYTMSKMFGISMHQAQAFDQLDISGGANGLDKFMSALQEASGGNIDSIGQDKLGILSELFNSSTTDRANLLKDSRISAIAQKNGWAGDTDITTMMKGIVASDIAPTETERMVSELTKIENAVEAAGEKAIPKLTTLVEKVNEVIDELTKKRTVENAETGEIVEVGNAFAAAGMRIHNQEVVESQAYTALGNTITNVFKIAMDGFFTGLNRGNPWNQNPLVIRDATACGVEVSGDGNSLKRR